MTKPFNLADSSVGQFIVGLRPNAVEDIAAVSAFLQIADHMVVAHVHTVVTHEKPEYSRRIVNTMSEHGSRWRIYSEQHYPFTTIQSQAL